MLKFEWLQNTFWLSDKKAIFWEDEKALMLSDLHLGKSGHFRKSGIAVPQKLMQEDLMRLFDLIQHFQPKEIIIVGDLFHSEANKEHDWFMRWRKDIAGLPVRLVLGNHDILEAEFYHSHFMETCTELRRRNLIFLHAPCTETSRNEADKGVVSGHIHPAVVLSKPGMKGMRLPCFHFSGNCCTLPAFGSFTGTYAIRPKKSDHIFVIGGRQVIALDN